MARTYRPVDPTHPKSGVNDPVFTREASCKLPGELNLRPLDRPILWRKLQLLAAKAPTEQHQQVFPSGFDGNPLISESQKGLYAPVTAQLRKDPGPQPGVAGKP
jgi:hypothetical protein